MTKLEERLQAENDSLKAELTRMQNALHNCTHSQAWKWAMKCATGYGTTYGVDAIGRFAHEVLTGETDSSMTPPFYTCPVCGMKSYNPNDIANKYCGMCHRFEGQDSLRTRKLKEQNNETR